MKNIFILFSVLSFKHPASRYFFWIVIDMTVMEFFGTCWDYFPVMLVLIIFSSIFSSSETAFFSLPKYYIRRLREKRTFISKFTVYLLESPKKLLTTILFGNNLVNILYFSISAAIVFEISKNVGKGSAVTASLIFLLLLVIFGEIIPKAVAIKFPKQLSAVYSTFLIIFERLIAPVRVILIWVIDKLLFLTKFEEDLYVTADELKMLIEIGENEGVLDRDEGRMISSVIEFRDIRVKEIMIPRVDVVCFDVRGTREELEELFEEEKVTRIPIFRRGIDNIIGSLNAKDLFLNPHKEIKDLLRKIKFVPEQAKVESVLTKFINEQISCAVVVDEYGGTAGFVTMEDILEHIVGELEDEFDDEADEVSVERVGANKYILPGKLSIREWNDFFDVELFSEKVDTLGGFVTSLFGKIPNEGEEVKYKNLIFKIDSVSKRRIRRILLEV